MNAANEPRNWLMYSGTLDSQRFSGLNQINRSTVGDLEMKWAYQIPQLDRSEAVPLVVDGVMFITEAPSNVVAVDAATGRQYWCAWARGRHRALPGSWDFAAVVIVLQSARGSLTRHRLARN